MIGPAYLGFEDAGPDFLGIGQHDRDELALCFVGCRQLDRMANTFAAAVKSAGSEKLAWVHPQKQRQQDDDDHPCPADPAGTGRAAADATPILDVAAFAPTTPLH